MHHTSLERSVCEQRRKGMMEDSIRRKVVQTGTSLDTYFFLVHIYPTWPQSVRIIDALYAVTLVSGSGSTDAEADGRREEFGLTRRGERFFAMRIDNDPFLDVDDIITST
jgi:hypothetical protein